MWFTKPRVFTPWPFTEKKFLNPCLPPVAEARDAAQHPAIYGTVPTAQHYLAPDVGGAWVEKLEEEGVPGGMK